MRISTKTIIGIAVAAIAAALLLPLTELLIPHKPLPGATAEDELSPQRSRLMEPEAVLKLMNPLPGSTALDLGSGFGLNTFRLARAVGPSGKVFATDVDPGAVDSLKQRIQKEGLQNVFPSLVSAHGIDSFYHEHQFDLILASDVITEIRHPEHFFDDLRGSLKKETGRLWVVNLRVDPDFSTLEFGDVEKLRKTLNSANVQSSLAPRLSPASREALNVAKPVGPQSWDALVMQDLNRMMEDPTLWPEVQKKRLPMNREDAVLRDVLSEMLEKAGVFAPKGGVTEGAKRVLRLLNRVVISDIMGSDVWSKAIVLNKLDKSQLGPLLAPLTFPEFWGRPKFFEQVGYELVRDHRALNYCTVLEYKRVR